MDNLHVILLLIGVPVSGSLGPEEIQDIESGAFASIRPRVLKTASPSKGSEGYFVKNCAKPVKRAYLQV